MTINYPIIGIECSSVQGELAAAPRAMLNVRFTQAIEKCGGVPFIIPPRLGPDSLDALLDTMDGLLLSGGPDIPPHIFGQEPHPLTKPLSDTRAVNAIHLIRGAVERKRPILGICFGVQAINVALGGTLLQDIHTAPHDARVKHKYYFSPDFTDHPITIEPGSCIADVMGGVNQSVNSCHHQSIDQPGAGLRISAIAPDGIVEAIESTNGARILGVQWHPEYLTDRPEQLALFQWVVDAARERLTAAL